MKRAAISVVVLTCVLTTAMAGPPVQIGHFDTSGTAHDLAIMGDHAYVADGEAGLSVIDVSDPAAPLQVGTHDTGGFARDIELSGDYAYVADDQGGLQIIDVSDPTSPVPVGGHSLGGQSQYYGVTLSGSYAFVSQASSGYSEVLVYDVSDPALPQLVEQLDTSGHGYDIEISGNYAYLAADTAHLLAIDVSDPMELGTPSASSGGPAGYYNDVFILGDYAYVSLGSKQSLEVFDISAPSSPVHSDGYDAVGAGSFATGVTASGDIAYLAAWDSGLHIVDISDPAQLTLISVFDTLGQAHNVVVSGDLVFVADGSNGLVVLPEPATLGLLCLGGLAVLKRRKS